MPGPFGYDVNITGAWVVVEEEPLCPGCSTDDEVDYQIGRLIASLQQAGRDMKDAIRDQKGGSPGLEVGPDA